MDAAKCASRFLYELGYTEVQQQADQEPASDSLNQRTMELGERAPSRPVPVIPRSAPTDSAQSQGSVGSTVQQIAGLTRSLISQLTACCITQFTSDEPIFDWMFRRASWCLAGVQSYRGGPTPYET